MSARFLWGTSGYAYDHWRGVFYPPGVRTSDRLAFYAQAFPAVELNVTFYRLPSEKAVGAWHDRTPEAFRFVAKGSRTITHYRRLLNAEEPLRTFLGRMQPLGGKLEALLWQLPPRMKADAERLDAFCGLLHRQAPRVRHAFEFRDDSWEADAVLEVLRRRGCGLVLADREGPLGPPVVTAPFTYLRFHGGTAGGSGYTEAELRAWARRARGWREEGCDVYAFFNNDAEGHAVADARRFADLMGM
jgi:uncharacterized protein YecE (DUF72 family)